MRIVCFGDSLTWGGYGGSYVEELRRLQPTHTWINAGVGGDTVLNLLARLDDDVLAHDPDGVFVMIGGNDAISYCYPATRPYYRKSKDIPDGHVTPVQYETAYRDLLSRLHAAHVVTWVGLSPMEYDAQIVRVLRDYNNRAAHAARTYKTPTLDLLARFALPSLPQRPPLSLAAINLVGKRLGQGWDDYETQRVREGFTFTFAGLHPTPEAARQMGRQIAAFILP